MFVFGLGTIPLLAATVFAGQWLTASIRLKFQRVVPYVVALVGVLMILRGLGLGIPYLSPPEKALQIRENTAPMNMHSTDAEGDHSCH